MTAFLLITIPLNAGLTVGAITGGSDRIDALDPKGKLSA